MLVLSRKSKEIIRIGDDITVRINRVKNGVVSIGIEAPKHIRVDREEVHQQRNSERLPPQS